VDETSLQNFLQNLIASCAKPTQCHFPGAAVVEIDEITDANGFEALRHAADATAIEVQFEDGRYFARTENVTAIDGSAPKFFTFIAFDNITKVKTFVDSIKATTALRTRVTKSRSFIVEGTMR
jgi:uncharacterized protein (DUF1330 family)